MRLDEGLISEKCHFGAQNRAKFKSCRKTLAYIRQNITHNTFFGSFDEFGEALANFCGSLKNQAQKIISLCKVPFGT
jgi:hypothetical protein